MFIIADGKITNIPRPEKAKVVCDNCLRNKVDIKLLNENARFIMMAHESIDTGFLPFKGGYLDQPKMFIEILKIIKRIDGEI